ncbi:hypothetical protein ACFFGH_17640 [Lysobacter korlensis]|uniref:Uncharacterized protein n=1 Tax=Lysobacter korlensis TaxID=553636 RepID=A0ABV6RRP4_9GAMM
MSTKTPLRQTGSANVFRGNKPDARNLTSEQIADHLAAFQRSGGKVEVLGITRTLKHVLPVAAEAVPAAAPAPAKKKKPTASAAG